jgi:hypothetical protein
MVTIGGSWDVWKAVVARWTLMGLTAKFTTHWAKGTSSSYAALNDGEARPGTPAPYCVLEQGTGLRDYRSSHESDSSKTRVTDSTLFQFRLHGNKTHLVALVQEIADAFDNAPLVVEGGSCHLDIQRQPDFSVREADTQWVWVIPYEVRFEYEQ